MLTTGRSKGDSGQATFVGYHGRHRSRPDPSSRLPTFTIICWALIFNLPTSDHCSITACFKVRQSGLTGADMNLEPQRVCHGGCPKHILRWNSDKALHYAEHLGNNIEGHNSFMKAIERKDVEAANNYLRAMIISAACNSNLGNFSGIFRLAFFIGRIKGWQLEPERLLGLMMYAGEREGIIYALWGTVERIYRIQRVQKALRRVARKFSKQQTAIFLDKLSKRDQAIYDMLKQERQPVHPLCLQMLGIPTSFHISMLNHLLNLLMHWTEIQGT